MLNFIQVILGLKFRYNIILKNSTVLHNVTQLILIEKSENENLTGMFYLDIWSTRIFGLYSKEFLKEQARKSPEEKIDLQFCFVV
jgi:hypothetical protein